MKGALGIFRFLLDASARGERTALLTLTGIEGSSARSLGTHMAVSETGAYAGNFTGGCIEAALVGEALRVVGSATPEIVRFGKGSRFIDIRLPCGGGIDVMMLPSPSTSILSEIARQLESRKTVRLGLDTVQGLHCPQVGGGDDRWIGSTFFAVHKPDLRIVIIGHGAETLALARLSKVYGAIVEVLSPDRAILQQMISEGIPARLLTGQGRSEHLHADPYTAVVTLFHDHDREIELLAQAAEEDLFFIGAMGSKQTHASRLASLRAKQLSETRLRAIAGPVGLIPAARDPDTLAISVLAQIVERYHGRLSRNASFAAQNAFASC